jgi:hypothetical protein
MSTEAMDSGPDPGKGRQNGDNGRKVPAQRAAEGDRNWEKVQEEYQRVVQALNRSRVSFTSRSAEGITLYGGLDSHNANGDMRKLAESGQAELLERIAARRQAEATESSSAAKEKPA